MKNSTRIKRFENKVAKAEFGKLYSELTGDDQSFVDWAVADLMAEYYESKM